MPNLASNTENIKIPAELQVKTLAHHGLCAGYIDKLKLVERIDARLPISKEKGAILTHGQRVKAMIINGLGFTQSPIYLTPNFFKNLPVEQLFTKGAKAEHFNDDALGRTLDAIYKYGATALFAEIANEIAVERMPKQNKVQLHIDTSSLKVSGDYDLEDNYPDDNKPPLPKYGHSKDHRPDLKQLVLSLTVSGPASLPIWFEGIDGNSQDKSNFHDTLAKINEFQSALQDAPDFLVVADSALYVNGKLKEAYYDWVTRVPENIKYAKELVKTDHDKLAWRPLDNGYQYVWIGHEDREMKQHWAMFHSEQAYKKETETLNKRIEKALIAAQKSSKKLSKQQFACEVDAQQAIDKFEKSLKYHVISSEIIITTKFSGRGRPSKSEKPSISTFQTQIELIDSPEKQQPHRNKLGRFILGTNQLDDSEIDASSLLSTYKEQQNVERGFRFIKDPQFHLNGIFLEKPERINSLMMIMTLCLMVYNIGQYEVREALKEQGETVKSQVGKATKTPTLRWLFQQMSGVYCVSIDGKSSCISGLTEEKRKIVMLCGEDIARIYQMV